MNTREIKKIIGKVEKDRLKIRKLSSEVNKLNKESNMALDQLAKDCCPFKKGQMFKKNGAVIWAKMTGISGTALKYGPIDANYIRAPYFVECLRCNVKGVTQKDKFIFIHGHEIGDKWEAV